MSPCAINRCQQVKISGVTIDSKLNLDNHILELCSKVQKILIVFSRISNCLDTKHIYSRAQMRGCGSAVEEGLPDCEGRSSNSVILRSLRATETELRTRAASLPLYTALLEK